MAGNRLFTVFFLTSFIKSTEDKQWKAEITENKAASFKEVFLKNGSEKLNDITASKDEVKMSDYNKMTANQIRILQGMDKVYDKLIEFKKKMNSELVVLKDNKIIRIKP